MSYPTVTVYSTPTWASCNAAKEFLLAKGIPYTSIDISQDAAARQEMTRLSGRMATPVIVVDGEVVVGFDRGKLQRLLGIWGLWRHYPIVSRGGHPELGRRMTPAKRDSRAGAATGRFRVAPRVRGKSVMGATIPCPECGRALEVPAGAKPGDTIDCPTWAGISLRLSRRDDEWRGTLVKRASCAVGAEEVILPDDVQPGDVIECHGVKQRVTYEYGAWALERA